MSNDFDEVPVVNKPKEEAVKIKAKDLPKLDTAVEEVPEVKDEVKPRWNKDELLEVFDKLLFEGEYTETFTIRGKLLVTFRSRSADETMKISREIDNTPFNLVSTVQEHKALLNMSYSLVNYSGKDFSDATQETIFNFIKKLPIFIVGVLIDKLSDFDSKVDAACKEAEENF